MLLLHYPRRPTAPAPAQTARWNGSIFAPSVWHCDIVESIWITSVAPFEARLGFALLADGKRRRALESAFARLLEEDLANRVLDFDTGVAIEAAALAAQRQRVGTPVDIRETQIAGIALARHAMLATRNVHHFADLNINVIDPWQDAER